MHTDAASERVNRLNIFTTASGVDAASKTNSWA